MKTIKQIVFVLAIAVMVQACKPAGGEFPGTEYMPDMAHPISYEANAYDAYKYHTWDEQSVMTRKELTGRMQPVKGTVPRGYAGVYFASGADAQQAVMDNLHGVGNNNAQAIPVNAKCLIIMAIRPKSACAQQRRSLRIHSLSQPQAWRGARICTLFSAAFATVKRATAWGIWFGMPTRLPVMRAESTRQLRPTSSTQIFLWHPMVAITMPSCTV
jgi:hypothetical protein